MSRAFVKEDGPEPSDDPPEKPVSENPNYVTARGLRLLEYEEKRLVEEFSALPPGKSDADVKRLKLRIERDLRYVRARLQTAIPVAPPSGREEIRFGARVALRREDGAERILHIVGEDEAAEGGERAPWAAPFVSALFGLRVGQTLRWESPEPELWTVLDIRYPVDVP
jgi:transcription elongation GreA/GreB family factor